MPSALARHHGVIIRTDAAGRQTEIPTFTCSHCNRIFRTWGEQKAGICLTCFRPICVTCAEETKDTERCVTFEEKIERDAEAAYRKQALRRAAGV